MFRTSIDAAIRSRVETFAAELKELFMRAAVQAVESALSGRSVVSTRKRDTHAPLEVVPEPAPYEMTPARPLSSPPPVTRLLRQSSVTSAKPPVSLEGYERMAIQRALAESGGNLTAAAKLLGVSKSGIYRRMRALGIELPRPGVVYLLSPVDPVARAGTPLSLVAYEKSALLRALNENGGGVVRAGEQLGMSKSATYRLMRKHGFHGARRPGAA